MGGCLSSVAPAQQPLPRPPRPYQQNYGGGYGGKFDGQAYQPGRPAVQAQAYPMSEDQKPGAVVTGTPMGDFNSPPTYAAAPAYGAGPQYGGAAVAPQYAGPGGPQFGARPQYGGFQQPQYGGFQQPQYGGFQQQQQGMGGMNMMTAGLAGLAGGMLLEELLF